MLDHRIDLLVAESQQREKEYFWNLARVDDRNLIESD